MSKKSISAPREEWLDGLRGVAALIVAWFHLTVGKIATPYRSFWDSPASENRYFFQIAPFRIIFAGNAMVNIFFVVSGYSISIGLIKLRNEGSLPDFYRRLTSSVVRRMFRLCFPVAVLMLTSHSLYYAGLYTMKYEGNQGCPGAQPWSSPIPHIQCLVRSFVAVINLQNNHNVTLNSHLWTIPVEIRNSFYVYFALLGLSTVSETVRLLAVGILCMRSWWNGTPDSLAFFAGLLFAEISASGSRKHEDSRLKLKNRSATKSITIFVHYSIFALGIYLLCLPPPVRPEGPEDATFSADWSFLGLVPVGMAPRLPWWDWETAMHTWHTLGAIAAVNSTRLLPRLRAPFESRTAQYLGHISFGLYLCHQTVYRVVLHWSLHWMSVIATGVSYFDAHPQGRWDIVFVAWVLSIPLIVMVLWLVSRAMVESVDQRSVRLGHYMEKVLSGL